MFRDSGPRLTTLLAVLLLVGCSPEPSLFEGVRKPSEPISQLEWDAFRRIVEQLPEGKLREFPAAELPLPQWQKARTLPVEELAAEEQSALTQAWEPT